MLTLISLTAKSK